MGKRTNHRDALSIRGVELVWKGKYDDRGQRVMPREDVLAADLHVTEQYGGDPQSNLLASGDNLTVMASLLDAYRGKLDLIYVDPPFCAGNVWKHDAAVGRGRERASADRADVEVAAYDDRWGPGGEDYPAMLFQRFVLMRELLSDTGSLFVHVDYRAHPYVRLLLEEVFGAGNLVNEIVWSYRSGGGTKRRFGCKHDNILFFSKTANYQFNVDAVRVPYDAIIPDKWRDKFHAGGKVCPDVWDISRPPNHSPEWVGYATQKPEALMERIIAATTQEGSLVADFFCGSATLAAVAHRMNRRWIVCDQSSASLHASRKRLASLDASFRVQRLNLPTYTGLPAGIDVRLEIAGVELHADATVLEQVDFWAFDTNDDKDAVFAPQWLDYRLPKKREMATFAPVSADTKTMRVLLVDVRGNEFFFRVTREQ